MYKNLAIFRGPLLIRVSVAKKHCFYQFFSDSCGFDMISDDNRCIRSEIFLPKLSKYHTSLVQPMFIHTNPGVRRKLVDFAAFFIFVPSKIFVSFWTKIRPEIFIKFILRSGVLIKYLMVKKHNCVAL